MNNIAGTEEKLSWLLTCFSICLISAEGAGVAGLSGLVESLAMLGLEVVPEVLHVLDISNLQLWPRLHRLAERVVNLTCGENLLLPWLLLLLFVESLGRPIVQQSFSSLRVPGGLDVSPVELGPDFLPRPGPAQPRPRLASAEAGLSQRVRGSLH